MNLLNPKNDYEYEKEFLLCRSLCGGLGFCFNRVQ